MSKLEIYEITPNEIPLASGTYTYYEDNETTGVTEIWTSHRSPDGSQFIRVERDSWSRSGNRVLIHAMYAPAELGGQIEQFEVMLTNNSDTLVRTAMTIYTFLDKDVLIGRTLNSDPQQDSQMPLPAGTVVYPLAHVFLGPIIAHVAAQNAAGEATAVPVFWPQTDDPGDEEVLQRRIISCTAWLSGTEMIEVAGELIAARRYQFFGNDYDERSSFWLDERGTMIRFVHAQDGIQKWRVDLTAHSRSPG